MAPSNDLFEELFRECNKLDGLKTDVYTRLQAKWIIANNLQPGDTLKVISFADNKAYGWFNYWDDEMDAYIGKEHKYRSNLGAAGILLEPGTYFFPFFVLEKVPKPFHHIEPKEVQGEG